MITINLDETSSGKTITVLSGINPDTYELRKVKRALKKITGCDKAKITEDNDIILLGSHVSKVSEFVTRIGF
jgi:translation initiation factor 1 (eIF-1/SUI1)